MHYIFTAPQLQKLIQNGMPDEKKEKIIDNGKKNICKKGFHKWV